MEVKAEKQLKLNQNPDMVWKMMIDPSFMVKSVPGAELTELLDDRNFNGKISLKIGPVTAKFNGEAKFTKLVEEDYELTLEGKGLDTSGKGGANMTMNIKLAPIDDGGTEMKSSMSLSITGRLAQFGARMIVAVNNKMFDQWAKSFTDLLNEQSPTNYSNEKSSSQQTDSKPVESTPVKAFPLAWAAIKGLFGLK
ncbi:MAG: SRPBCC family protein [Rhodospirillales bacterium]|nr:SRPBCC family protein [Rhodospirillales bacterium]